jgi:hypothetical protein
MKQQIQQRDKEPPGYQRNHDTISAFNQTRWKKVDRKEIDKLVSTRVQLAKRRVRDKEASRPVGGAQRFDDEKL